MSSHARARSQRKVRSVSPGQRVAAWWGHVFAGVRVVGRRLSTGPGLYPRKVGVWLAALSSGGVVFGWFEKGKHIATGDVSPFIHHNMAVELGSLWNHAQSGAGSITYMVARAYQILMEEAVLWLGGSSAAAQQLYFMVLAALAAGGVAYLVSAVVRRPGAIWAAGMFAVVNPFLLTRMPNALILYALALGGMAGGILVRSGRGVMRWGGLKLGLLGLAAAPLAYNPPMLAVLAVSVLYLAVIAVVAGRAGAVKRVAKVVAVAAPVAVVVNLWWLVPLYYTLFGDLGGVEVAAVTDVTSWQWTHRQNSLGAVFTMTAHHAWGMAQYYPATVGYGGLVGYVVYVIPVVVCGSWLLMRRRANRVMMWLGVVGVGILVFLSKGLHEPWGEVNLWLYENVAGFWLLREPGGKLGPLLVTIYALGLGVVLDQLWRPAARRRVVDPRLWTRNPFRRMVRILRKDRLERGEARVRNWMAVAVCVAGVVAGWPLVVGTVIPDERPIFPSGRVEVPEAWYEVAAYVNAETGRYEAGEGSKVLTLPVNDYYQMPTTWGYYGVDTIPASLLTTPLVNHQPGGYYGEQLGYGALLEGVTSAVYDGELETLERLADRLGVSHLVMRKDIDFAMVAGRRFADPGLLAGGIQAMGLEPVYSNEVADVYRIGDGAGLKVYQHAVVADQSVVGDERALRVGLGYLSGETVLVSGADSQNTQDLEAAFTRAGVAPAGEMAGGVRTAVPTEAGGGQIIWAGEVGSYLEVVAENGEVTLGGAGALDGERGDVVVAFDRDSQPVSLASVSAGASTMWVPNLSTLAVFDTELLSVGGGKECAEGECGWELNLYPGEERAQRSEVGSVRAVLVTVNGAAVEGATGIGSPCVQTGWGGWARQSSEPCWQLIPLAGAAEGPVGQHRQYLAIEELAWGLVGAERVTVGVRGAASAAVTIERLVPRPGELTVGGQGRSVGETPFTAEDEFSTRAPRSDGQVIIGELGRLSDCNKVDNAPVSATGLFFEETARGWLLGADRHSACVGINLEVVGEVPLIEIGLDVTRLEGGHGRVCVYSTGLRRCLGGPSVASMNGAVGERARYEASFVLPAGERHFELFTYADSEGVPGRTEVRYENLVVRPSEGQIHLEVTENHSQGEVAAPVVVLEESYSRGWVLETPEGQEVEAVHVLADGWANGWMLTEDPAVAGYDLAELVVRFAPQRHAELAVLISAVAVAVIGLSVFSHLGWRRRMRRG